MGRHKGFTLSPLQKLASKRNWDNCQIVNAKHVLQRAAKEVGRDDLASTLNFITSTLTLNVDSKWEKDRAKLKELQHGASKDKEEVGTDFSNPVVADYFKSKSE